jgi:hypothetical protein
MVLDGQEGGSEGVRGLKERCWVRFLKGMVTDRNKNSHPVPRRTSWRKYPRLP